MNKETPTVPISVFFLAATLAATLAAPLAARAQDSAASTPPATHETVSVPLTPRQPSLPLPPAPEAVTLKSTAIASKFAADIYGFVEFDAIHDSTQSFNDLAGNGAIARDNYAARHQRTTFGVRNSRIGFKMKGPDSDSVKTSAIMEMDFFGNQPTGIAESAFFVNPGFRVRHFALKLETPIVDVLLGQYWQLFGWQSMYHPNTVEIQGVPGQVYSRSPQIRVSRTIKTDDINIEVAVAAVRPPQRDSSTPDGQAGLRLVLNKWKGLHTAGGTGTAIDGASVGVSGIYRHFEVAEFAPSQTEAKTRNGSGISVDALLPVIPATPESKGNALTLTGSFVRGTGIADMYTGLSGGIAFPAVPTATGTATYSANIDNGLVAFDTVDKSLHTINWTSWMAGFQYYLPPTGWLWVSGNISGMKSTNIGDFANQYGTASKVFGKSLWADGNVFVDVNKAVRLGAELAYFRQTYADGHDAHNYRGQVSAFYIF